MTVSNKIGGKVFGELKVNAVSNQSLELLHSELILQQDKELFWTKSGQQITLDIHDIFVENENNLSNKAKVTFVVSIHVDSDSEKNAMFQANSIFNEASIEFYNFSLENYTGDTFSFNVIDFEINWNEFLHSDEM